MNRNTVIRTGVAGAVAAAGLVVGGVAMANADDSAPAGSYSDGPKGAGPMGDGHRGGPGAGMHDTAAFAKALGVSEAKLTAALKVVRPDVMGDKPAAGERPDPAARETAMAAALAKELGISEAKVTAALTDLRAAGTADRRAELSTRLDTSVKAGDLTAADKASVLKAFDAGVLGGPGPR